MPSRAAMACRAETNGVRSRIHDLLLGPTKPQSGSTFTSNDGSASIDADRTLCNALSARRG